MKRPDGGYLVYHKFTRSRPGLPPYSTRIERALQISSSSVKLQDLSGLIEQICYENGRKVMVFAVWPATLTLVELYLTVIGIPFYSIRAAYSQPQRQNAILKFNDPSDPVKILLCSSRSAATSFNAQRSCADMIILEIPWNLSTVDQMVGRLWRVGQDKEVKVHILVVDFTYDQVIQARATRKVIAQLASQAEASDRKAEGNAAPVGSPTTTSQVAPRA